MRLSSRLIVVAALGAPRTAAHAANLVQNAAFDGDVETVRSGGYRLVP